MRAEARARFEAGDVDSCGAPAEKRRRSGEELRGGEALDNPHGSAAKRTSPQRVNRQRRRGGAGYWLTGWLEQPETEWKKLRSPSIGEEAEVADAHKTARQQVEEEAAQELIDGQSHQPLLVAVSRVAPAKGHVALGESNQPAVGNGDTMGIGAQIAQHMFRPAERPLGVDDPVVAKQDPKPSCEGARFRKRYEMSVELECTGMKGGLEAGDKLAAEDTAEYFDGKEEGSVRGDPAGVIRSEAAGGQHAVDMGMMLQSLIPGMEHAEETDLRAEVTRIAGDLQQGGSTGAKQQVIDQPFILQCERSQFPWQGEDGVHVAGGQQLTLPRLEPAQAGVALTLGAVPVSARVVRDGSMSAVRALIAMSTQRGGAAACDGQQQLFVLSVDPLTTALNEGLSCATNDIGHLQRRPVHAL